MTKNEALKLALEALDKYGFAPCNKEEDWQGFKRAIAAIKEALAQPEQEPVAWRFRSGTWLNREVHWRYIDTLESAEGLRGLQPLYTTPPHRKPLTSEEYSILAEKYTGADGLDCVDYGRAVARHYGIKE